MTTFAIVPIYNENPENLISVLTKLKSFVDSIVVVDDGSDSINNYQLTTNKNCYLLRHQINRGQGAALQTGTDFAIQHGADIIIHFDGDGQHRPEDIPDLAKPIRDGKADFVFGSRFLGKESNMPWTKKYLIQPIARLINQIFTGLKLSDAHNGMRAFSSTVASHIRLTQDRMAHNTEYPYLVRKHNIKYTEVPIKVIYHQYGQGMGGGVRIIKELVMGKMIN